MGHLFALLLTLLSVFIFCIFFMCVCVPFCFDGAATGTVAIISFVMVEKLGP